MAVNPYTQAELDEISEMHQAGVPIEDIAKSVGRNPLAVRQKLYQLGASNRSSAAEPSIEDIARERMLKADEGLAAIERRRQELISEKAKYQKILIALGVAEEEYRCEQCNRDFANKSAKSGHMNREHPVKVHVGEGIAS